MTFKSHRSWREISLTLVLVFAFAFGLTLAGNFGLTGPLGNEGYGWMGLRAVIAYVLARALMSFWRRRRHGSRSPASEG
jgi:hypothetical protein